MNIKDTRQILIGSIVGALVVALVVVAGCNMLDKCNHKDHTHKFASKSVKVLQQEQGEASHPEGISHPDNVRQYEEETGSKAKNWGLGPPVHIEGNILGQAVDHTFNAEGETVNPDTQRRTTAGDTVRPQVIGNMAWPWASREGRDFTSTNKAEMS